jgi:hypothetical protein
VADRLLLDRQLLPACLPSEIVDRRDDLPDGRVRGIQRLDHLLLGHLLRARLDHDQTVLAAGDNEIELARLALLEGRIDDVLPVDHPDADAGNRLLERDLRQGERRRCAGNREHIGIVLGIGRQDERDDLRLEPPPRREQGPDRPIDHAAGQHFFFRRLPLALEKAAGDPARRIRVLAVIDRQRKEVDSLARVRRAARGHEHDRITVPDDDGAVRLLGELAGFEAECLLADVEFAGSHRKRFNWFRRLKSSKAWLPGGSRLWRYLRMLRRLISSA